MQRQEFRATIPGLGRVPLVNLIAVARGRSPDAIVVTAHRDAEPLGRGANDNASGTAVLIELARAYANARGAQRELRPAHTLLFVSTDGGAFGGLGAEHLATSPAYRDQIVGVLNLDAVAGSGPARLELAGDTPSSPDAVFVETVATRLHEQTGRAPGRTSALGQLIDLGFPFSLYEQAPFVGRGIPAVTITTSGNRPEQGFGDVSSGLNGTRLAQIGRAAQLTLGSLDQVGVGQGGSTYIYLGARFVRGWALELALIAALLPFLIAAVDLFARCRRRGIRLRPAFRAYRARAGFWVVVALLFSFLNLLGAWPQGASRPPNPATEAAGTWPPVGLAVLGILAAGAWLAARRPLLPARPASAADELAGQTAALVSLGVLALLVTATNPFALVFLLPSLHAWIWLPQVREAPAAARAALLLVGFSGPALLLGSFALRFELGLDAPWYVAVLLALGYVPLSSLAIAVGWTAAAAQLVAIGAGRYAPYPTGAQRPPRGPVREVVRATILTILRLRTHRRAAQAERRVLEA
ncbi:MAG: M28 family peptidase [Gaiellaceae bacterium]